MAVSKKTKKKRLTQEVTAAMKKNSRKKSFGPGLTKKRNAYKA